MRTTLVAVLAAVSVLLAGTRSFSQPAPTDEDRIRLARAESNSAIREHDANRLASFWAQDYSLVSSTNQQVIGRETNRSDIARHFDDRPDVVYVRTPKEVGLYDPWQMAYEIGTWEGTWTDAGSKITIGGTYLAKWQRRGDSWLIQAEIFVPTHCEGSSYCDARP